ncbi:MAG TPA: glycosyltransferase family 39 protein [Vicinamibacteria bacterium]|nr:glycosyltransferase family 39 protein [Vicinamibacteria bacterium]
MSSALFSAWVQGETYDEPAHIAYARRLVETGETERLSVLHYNSKTPGSVPNAIARQAAKQWLGVRGPDRLLFFARLPTVLTLAVLLAAVFVIGRRFLGEAAAALATTACALDPNLIANSSVATVDTLYALATLLTLGAVLRAAQRPSVGRVAAVGATLGLAFAVKFSAFLLVPAAVVFPVLIPKMRARLHTWKVAAGALAAACALLAVIGAAYRFHDFGAELNDIGWRSPLMLRLHGLAPHLRLPLPADFVTGFDLLAVAVDKDYPVVVLGQSHPRGVWYYFLVVWLLKEPVLLLAAQLYGLARTAATRALWTDSTLAYLGVNLALSLAYFSFFFATQVGLRFVLMCLPMIALIAGAGLAPLVATARGRLGVVVVALAALAENVPYLGNHLAFTNAAVWPKREAFRLLTNANIDWGQNDDKIGGWLQERGLGAAAFNPFHALPGENVFDLNALAGVGKFRQHLWLREHASPRAHLGHTYLWLTIDPATYERMLEESRHLRPSAVDARLCEGASPAGPLVDGAAVSLPDLGRTQGLILCVSTSSRLDLGLFAEAGTVVLGPGREPRREQSQLGPGQQSWYRLEPGTSALAAFSASGLRGRWAVRGGAAALATRPVPVERGTIAEDPSSPR